MTATDRWGTDRWSDLLAEYEARLDRQEAFLAATSRVGVDTADLADGADAADLAPPTGFVAPHRVPAPPPHLRERLEELRLRTAELERRSIETLARLERTHRRPSAPTGTVASMFDRTL